MGKKGKTFVGNIAKPLSLPSLKIAFVKEKVVIARSFMLNNTTILLTIATKQGSVVLPIVIGMVRYRKFGIT